ncbi:MAG: DUF1799 domain-containing protein [Nitrospirae bacterium]|nr:DUF1799 domain-containing protein [Magnetococcales bacterium]HAT50745.1 hypothetical protein [Alphaproteobacteria bacterium]
MQSHGDQDTAQEDLAAWNAPDAVVAAMARSEEEDACIVWPENESVLRLFLRLQTAWRDTGLDYPSVRVVMESLGRWPDDACFADIQAMEYAVLDEWRSEP